VVVAEEEDQKASAFWKSHACKRVMPSKFHENPHPHAMGTGLPVPCVNNPPPTTCGFGVPRPAVPAPAPRDQKRV